MADGSVNSTFERVRQAAMAFAEAREEFSFGPEHHVFKAVNGKIFAIVTQEGETALATLKLQPEEVLEALTLPFVGHAPYMAKAHWVQARVSNEGELAAVEQWLARSHELVGPKPKRGR